MSPFSKGLKARPIGVGGNAWIERAFSPPGNNPVCFWGDAPIYNGSRRWRLTRPFSISGSFPSRIPLGGHPIRLNTVDLGFEEAEKSSRRDAGTRRPLIVSHIRHKSHKNRKFLCRLCIFVAENRHSRCRFYEIFSTKRYPADDDEVGKNLQYIDFTPTLPGISALQ